MEIILVRKSNNLIYKSDEDNKFTNMKTNESGFLSDEQVSNYFFIPSEFNKIAIKYPKIIELIEVLQCNATIKINGEGMEYNYNNKTLKKV